MTVPKKLPEDMILLDAYGCHAAAVHTENMLQRLVQARRQALCSAIVLAFKAVPELVELEVFYSNKDKVYVHGTDVIATLEVSGKKHRFSVDAEVQLAAQAAGVLPLLLDVRHALQDGGMVDLYLFDFTTVLDGGGKILREEALAATHVYEVLDRLNYVPRSGQAKSKPKRKPKNAKEHGE